MGSLWKLLIADDEPKIRRGLANVLPWEEMGISLVGEAENGVQAVEMARHLQPDLLFVDINMPLMDGLAMIEQLGLLLERSVVIVISGHDEFRYAQQAVQLKVFDYLLKPVLKSKLESVVSRALEKLEEVKRSSEELSTLSQQMQKNSAMIRDHFLVNWMDGLVNAEDADWNLNYFRMMWPGSVRVTVIKPVHNADSGKKTRVWDKKLLEFAVRNIAEDVVRAEANFPAAVWNDLRGQTILVGAPHNPFQWDSLIGGVRDKAEDIVQKNLLMETGETGEGSRGIPALYKQLMRELGLKGGLSPIVILTMKYIERQYHLPSLTLSDVAEGVQVSSTYLSKQLKREMGLSFIDYLTEVRIRKAIQLMNDPHLKVYEIAGHVGYSSQHYFSSAFKRVTGHSPMLYKRGIHK
jgi:two-component system response regulator YesN